MYSYKDIDQYLFTDVIFQVDKETIQGYCQELFEDMYRRTGQRFLDVMTFQEVLQFPLFIAEKIFRSFYKKKAAKLAQEEFVNGVCSLYSENNFENKIRLVFNIFDFDGDSRITFDDVSLLLSHFHMIGQSSRDIEYLIEIVKNSFSRSIIEFEEFFTLITSINSDIYALFIFFLYAYSPIKAYQLEYYERQKQVKLKNKRSLFNLDFLKEKMYFSKCTEKFNDYILKVFLKFEYDYADSDVDIELLTKFEEDLEKSLSILEDDLISFRLDSNSIDDNDKYFPSDNQRLLPKKKLSQFFTSKTSQNQNASTSSQSVFSDIKKIGNKYSSSSNTSLLKLKTTKMTENSAVSLKPSEYYLFSFSRSKKIKKILLAIKGDAIFYFKYDPLSSEFRFKEILSLKSRFAMECFEITLDGTTYYPFQLISTICSTKYSLTFLCTSESDVKWIVSSIREGTRYRRLEDDYYICKEIGQGKYGKVLEGENKLTREKVAIKILSKLTEDKTNMNKRECDIFKFLKNVSHPGIIKAIEMYETFESIYLVFEYISEGNLKTYIHSLKEDKFKVSLLHNLITQLLNAVDFLNNYGIIHRDLKPANILVSIGSQGEPVIKIIDFGFAKIMGRSELTCEPFGSLCYTAPEIILNRPYNHLVDIWSLGVIIYYLTFKTFPFMDTESDQEKIKDAISFGRLLFPISKNIYKEKVNKFPELRYIFMLIRACLSKSIDSRPNIRSILNQAFLNENYDDINFLDY